jgi:TatD DNase family protein
MLGLHPWRAEDAPRDWGERLEALLRKTQAGVGECGLDFTRQAANHIAQTTAFRRQIRLAHALGRPLAVHAVRAWGPLLDILREEGVPHAGAFIHGFGGSPETARALQAMGLMVSFSGDLLDPARYRVREALSAVTDGNLLLESDGTADLAAVYETAASLRGVAVAQLIHLVWENGRRCFEGCMA